MSLRPGQVLSLYGLTEQNYLDLVGYPSQTIGFDTAGFATRCNAKLPHVNIGIRRNRSLAAFLAEAKRSWNPDSVVLVHSHGPINIMAVACMTGEITNMSLAEKLWTVAWGMRNDDVHPIPELEADGEHNWYTAVQVALEQGFTLEGDYLDEGPMACRLFLLRLSMMEDFDDAVGKLKELLAQPRGTKFFLDASNDYLQTVHGRGLTADHFPDDPRIFIVKRHGSREAEPGDVLVGFASAPAVLYTYGLIWTLKGPWGYEFHMFDTMVSDGLFVDLATHTGVLWTLSGLCIRTTEDTHIPPLEIAAIFSRHLVPHLKMK